MIRTAVIPAGGYGSRMEPITKAIPKPMLPIIRKPVIHYIVEEAIQSGLKHIIIVAGYKANVIKDYFFSEQEFDSRSYGPKNYFEDADIEFISQDEPKGLADAILCTKNSINNEKFAILLGDDIFRSDIPGTAQLCKNMQGNHMIGCLEMPKYKLRNYGVIISDENENPFNISKIIEKPNYEVSSNLAVAGRYVFGPSVFNALETVFAEKDTSGNLTDAVNLMIDSGEIVHGLKMDGIRYDVGNENEYITTLKAAIDERW